MSRRPFVLLVLLACLVGSPAAVSAAGVEFVRVWPGWRDADAFERIGEYFGKPENTGRDIVIRTEPSTRGGFYFLVRVKASGDAPTPARFELNVIRPDKPEPVTHTFPVSLPAKETVYQLGLTGAAWPGGKEANPVAWRLALLGADGRVLAEQKSFLWEKPRK